MYSIKLYRIAIIALLLTSIGCSSNNKVSPIIEEPISCDTLLVDWNSSNVPMALNVVCEFDDNYNELNRTLMHIFSSEEDSVKYTPYAEKYHVFISGDNQHHITFTEIQPNGREWGSIIVGKYSYCMKGLNYKVDNIRGNKSGNKYSNKIDNGFAFTDDFLANHHLLQLKYSNAQVPAHLIDTLQSRYCNKVLDSCTCAVVGNGTAVPDLGIYSVQMKPKEGKCLGMRVVSVGDSLYVYEDWSEERDGEYSWNVDDGGNYLPFTPIAVTKGEKGYDIFYYESAPEGSTFGALLLRNSKLVMHEFNSYYHYIDYIPNPLPTRLPNDSKLVSERDGYKVWIHTDVEPDNADEAGQYSVYYSTPESDAVYFAVKSNANADYLSRWNNNVVTEWVTHDEVASASDAFIVKHPEYDTYYLILQGCPDARNIYTYVIDLPINNIEPYFHWIHTNSGFQGLDSSGELLRFANYGYHDDGGRYTTYKYLDFNFNLVKEENE